MSRTFRRTVAAAVAVAGLALSCCALVGASQDMDRGTTARERTFTEAQVGP